ncbi:MAG: PEGA domain-containing protein, partial [Pseudomonadales bacterium]
MTRLILLLAYLALATSCASITRGSTESFAIETTPTDAEVTVTHTGGEEQCTSPCLVEVKRKGHLMIKIVKEGYKVHTTTIQSSIDGGGKAGMA